MPGSNIQLTHDIYLEYLTDINGIQFTHREIDIIACLTDPVRADKISQILDLDRRTISTIAVNIKRKLGLSSNRPTREIIDVIRTFNDEFEIIKNRYLPSLLIRTKFEEHLRRVSRIIKRQSRYCYESVYYIQHDLSPAVNQLRAHLKLAGILVRDKDHKSLSKILPTENEDICFSFYLVPLEISEFVKEYSDINNFKKFTLEENHRFGEVIILRKENGIYLKDSLKLRSRTESLSLKKENYYFTVFKILKELYSNIGIDSLITSFKDELEKPSIINDLNPHNPKIVDHTPLGILKKPRIWILSVCICLSIIGLLFYLQKINFLSLNKMFEKDSLVRSELKIPSETSLLNRQDLITKIDNRFKRDQGIQTVALVGVVGIGGAGKTVLARQFGKTYPSTIVWELNAERKESLINSFLDLAHALAKTNNQKQELAFINAIQDSEEKERELLSIIKSWLREKQNWLLIYDNVEDIGTIKDYLPQDPYIWGKGNVIVTTRDTNIENTEYIKQNNVIYIEELSNNEKLALFSQIYYNQLSDKLTPNQRFLAINFLKNIPPYPLDISASAHYLKATNTSFNKYLENLDQHSVDFENAQVSLLKEGSHYTKTRYNIIKTSLNSIITAQKDFIDLALFISLLDSQNIPRSLLDRYTNNVKVGNFIYYLKKYSLITSESSTASEQTFSIHRSTQSIMLAYLVQILKLKHHKQYLNSITKILAAHMADINDAEDHSKAYFLVNHGNMFLNHIELLTDTNIAAIKSEMGGIYFLLHDMHKAESFLKTIEETLNKNDLSNKYIIARSLVHRGRCWMNFSDLNMAGASFQRSLDIYKAYFPENHTKVAEISAHLGRLEIERGNCKKAQNLFKEAYNLYTRYDPDNHSRICWALNYIGNVERELGDYKNAKDKLEEVVRMYNKYSQERFGHMGWVLVLLGNVYRDLGDYQKALSTLQQGVSNFNKLRIRLHLEDSMPWETVHLANTYRKLGYYKIAKATLQNDIDNYIKHYPENKSYKSWATVHLGNVYTDMGQYKQAKDLLERELEAYKKLFSEDNIHTAWVLAHLGNVYNSLEDYLNAKNYLEHSLKIHDQYFSNNHIKIAWVQLYLGNTYMGLGDFGKAYEFLKKSLSIHQKHYGSNHVETAKVLVSLGSNDLAQGKLESAEDYYNKALIIFKEKQHPDIYIAQEKLAELYLKQIALQASNNKKNIIILKNKALSYITQALEIANNQFLEESAHKVKIKNTLKAIQAI